MVRLGIRVSEEEKKSLVENGTDALLVSIFMVVPYFVHPMEDSISRSLKKEHHHYQSSVASLVVSQRRSLY